MNFYQGEKEVGLNTALKNEQNCLRWDEMMVWEQGRERGRCPLWLAYQTRGRMWGWRLAPEGHRGIPCQGLEINDRRNEKLKNWTWEINYKHVAQAGQGRRGWLACGLQRRQEGSQRTGCGHLGRAETGGKFTQLLLHMLSLEMPDPQNLWNERTFCI